MIADRRRRPAAAAYTPHARIRARLVRIAYRSTAPLHAPQNPTHTVGKRHAGVAAWAIPTP